MDIKKVIALCSTVIIATAYASNIVQADTTTSSTTGRASIKCSRAVKMYLNATKVKKKDYSKTVEVGSNIIVDYIGRLGDGKVFDTSIRSIARACGTYQTARDYKSGLPFTAGEGQMIAGFDQGVLKMNPGSTKTLIIPANEAYGEKYITLPIDQLPAKVDNTPYKIGDEIMTMNGPIMIESLNDKEFTILNTHPLAGKDLIFDVTIKKIN